MPSARLASLSDADLFVRAEGTVQSSAWFTCCFAAYPILLLAVVPIAFMVLIFAPVIGGPLVILSGVVLVVPWVSYRRRLRSLHRQLIEAREGRICGNCWYDLVGIESKVCPECGTPREAPTPPVQESRSEPASKTSP